MPLYVFACGVCGNLKEVLQKYTDPEPEVCEECGAAESMERQVGSSHFHLKGSGWYKDGYSKKDKK